MKSSFPFFLFYFFVFPSLISQEFWTPLYGPRGIYIDEMEVANDGTLYTTRFDKGVWKSTDGGKTMIEIRAGLPDDVFKVDNLVLTPNGRLFVRVLRFSSNYVEGIFKLNESGDAFELVEQGKWKTTVDKNGEIFLVGQLDHMRHSVDGGETFEDITIDGSWLLGNSYFPFSLSNGFVYFTTVSGNSSFSGLYRIQKNGSLVEKLDFPFSSALYLPTMALHPSGDVYAGQYGLFKSSDDGITWEEVNIGTYLNGVFDLVRQVIIDEQGRIYVISDPAVIYSDDEGTTWEELDIPNTLDWTYNLNHLVETIDHLVINNNNMYYSQHGCEKNVFARSIDGGQTWEELQNSYQQPSFSEVIKSQSNLYVKRCPAFERSFDNSQTWESFFIDGFEVDDILAVPNGVLYALTGSDLYRSFDGGATWGEIPSYLTSNSFDEAFVNPNYEIYIQGNLVSNDGTTWSYLPQMDDLRITGMGFHPNGTIYAIHDPLGGQTLLYSSIDEGETWTPINTGLNDLFNVHINAKGHAYVFGESNFVKGVFVSTDSFTTVNLVLELEDVEESIIVSDADGDVFLGTDVEGVYMTQDDGDSWEKLCEDGSCPENIHSLFIDQFQYLYAGADKIYRSTEPVSYIKKVTGKIYFDENENCLYDSSETLLKNWIVTADATDKFFGTSNIQGEYNFGLPINNYVLNASISNSLWNSTCNNNFEIDLGNASDTNTVDFPLWANELCPSLEMDFSTPLLRRCFQNTYTFYWCNKGTAIAENASIRIILDPYFIFKSATFPIFSQNGNEYIFELGDVPIQGCGHFNIIVEVGCDASLGQEHCVEAGIFPGCNGGEISKKECRPNIGSYDPNDKTAFVEDRIQEEWVLKNTDIEFLIRFQNTGTDTAFNIVIEDRLSNLLDAVSVLPGASSHTYTWSIDHTGLLKFSFENIMLPDSNINEVASHGFVKFKVSQKQDLPDGLLIRNKADIYFDFNEVVETNTVELMIGELVAVFESFKSPLNIAAFPNPVSDLVNIEFPSTDEQQHSLLLCNIEGILMRKISFNGGSIQLNCENLSAGIYFLMVLDNQMLLGTTKIVLQ